MSIFLIMDQRSKHDPLPQTRTLPQILIFSSNLTFKAPPPPWRSAAVLTTFHSTLKQTNTTMMIPSSSLLQPCFRLVHLVIWSNVNGLGMTMTSNSRIFRTTTTRQPQWHYLNLGCYPRLQPVGPKQFEDWNLGCYPRLQPVGPKQSGSTSIHHFHFS